MVRPALRGWRIRQGGGRWATSDKVGVPTLASWLGQASGDPLRADWSRILRAARTARDNQRTSAIETAPAVSRRAFIRTTSPIASNACGQSSCALE